MKRIFIILMAFVSLSASAQFIIGDREASKPVVPGDSRAPGELCLVCDPTSMFSNLPSLSSGAGISDDLTCYTSYDNFAGLNNPIRKVIFWAYDLYPSGGNYYGCTASDKNFEIGFYYDNDQSVGNELVKYQVTAVKIFCTESLSFGSAPLFVYEAELPNAVNLQEGWISIRAIGGQGACWFSWCLSDLGDQLIWQDCYSSFSSYTLDFAFCLLPAENNGGDENQGTELPLSNWALFIGIVLIAFMTILRWRKIL